MRYCPHQISVGFVMHCWGLLEVKIDVLYKLNIYRVLFYRLRDIQFTKKGTSSKHIQTCIYLYLKCLLNFQNSSKEERLGWRNLI